MGKGAKRDEDRENRREKGGYEKLGSRLQREVSSERGPVLVVLVPPYQRASSLLWMVRACRKGAEV